MAKYRVSRPDRHNWTLERWRPPYTAKKAGRGIRAGQKVEGKWEVEGYFSRFSHMLSKLVDSALGEEVGTGYSDLRALREALDRVESKILGELEIRAAKASS